MDLSLIRVNKIQLITSWSHIMDTNSECTICRRSLNSDSVYAIDKGIRSVHNKGICGHIFHNECIKPWLIHNTKCPICSLNF